MAIQEANYQRCDVDIVLATIEAESQFINILGDNGQALGFGQVWPAFWRSSFDYAGERLGIPVPNDLSSLQELTTLNDAFSLIVAVKTIKSVWLSSNKDWNAFTLSYVGVNIPAADYSRRKAIWDRYNDGSMSGNQTGFGSNINPLGGNDTNAIQPTNLGIVENSIRSNGNILYGRRYRILVVNELGNGLDVSDLRCTFKVTKTLQMNPNISEVTIYNLNPQSENTLIEEGNRIIIEAGYEGEQYGIIFDGSILQPIRDKEEGTTYKLTLTSLDGDRFFNDGFINASYVKGMTKRKITEALATDASNPAQLGNISQGLESSELTRGKVVFGLSRDYLRQVAQSNNATFYIDNGKVNIVKAEDIDSDSIIELSPQSGLIGTPTQNESGVTIKCLLNPRITVNKLVHIDNRLVRENQIAPVFTKDLQKPSAPIIRNLDNDGIYRVIKVTYSGDTRGDEWFCELECINQAGLLPSIATTSDTKVFN
jgi:hypothetical protein